MHAYICICMFIRTLTLKSQNSGIVEFEIKYLCAYIYIYSFIYIEVMHIAHCTLYIAHEGRVISWTVKDDVSG